MFGTSPFCILCCNKKYYQSSLDSGAISDQATYHARLGTITLLGLLDNKLAG